MKRIDFLRDSTFPQVEEWYEMIYDAMIAGPRGFNGIEEERRAGKILDKLEEVGKAQPRGEPPRDSYVLSEAGGSVVLEEAEYKLLVEAVRAVRWSGLGVRRAVAIKDWLDAAPSHLTEMVDPSAKA